MEAERSSAVFLHGAHGTEPVTAPWAHRLLRLGECLRQHQVDPEWQAVVLVSAPTRELAASLITTGWSLARPLTEPLAPEPQWLETVSVGSLVRLTLKDRIVVGPFYGYDGKLGRVRVAGSAWLLDRVTEMTEVGTAGALPSVQHFPAQGSLLAQQMKGQEPSRFWCSAQVDAALIGVLSRIEEELDTGVSVDARAADSLRNLVLPAADGDVVGATRLCSGLGVTELDPNEEFGMVVLDGLRGMAWLDDLWHCPLVVAVLDRTQRDDLLVDTFLQRRASGRSLPLAELNWRAGDSIQALAYEVPR